MKQCVYTLYSTTDFEKENNLMLREKKYIQKLSVTRMLTVVCTYLSVAENLQAQYSAIKMLASRVRLIAEYVRASQRGEVEFNHEILRQVNALAHRLPVLSNDKFHGEFYNVSLVFL